MFGMSASQQLRSIRRSAFDPVLHRAEALTADRIAAENYFQPAERYLLSMGQYLDEEPQRRPLSENFSDFANLKRWISSVAVGHIRQEFGRPLGALHEGRAVSVALPIPATQWLPSLLLWSPPKIHLTSNSHFRATSGHSLSESGRNAWSPGISASTL